jgi:hypothetical protein
MKFNGRMPKALVPFYREELEAYHYMLSHHKLELAWTHLERAHVLGQAYPLAHSRVHWLMLKFGFHIKSVREIIGQLPRLLVGGVKSFVNVIPTGNTGGANIPPLQSLPITPDLLAIFKSAGITSHQTS